MNTLEKLQHRIKLLEPAFRMVESVEAWNENEHLVLPNMFAAIDDDSEWGDTSLSHIFVEEIVPMVSDEMANELMDWQMTGLSFLLVNKKDVLIRHADKFFQFVVSNPNATGSVCSSVISNIYKYISEENIEIFLDSMESDRQFGRWGLFQLCRNKNLTREQAIRIAKHDASTIEELFRHFSVPELIEFSQEAPTWVISGIAKVVSMDNEELVEWLRTHKNANVRKALAQNPRADRGLLTMLTVDTKKSVINAALKALGAA